MWSCVRMRWKRRRELTLQSENGWSMIRPVSRAIDDTAYEVLIAQELRRTLSHVLWIGGATDTGKTTAARIIAERYGLQLHNYDRHDLPQIERLAQTLPRYPGG